MTFAVKTLAVLIALSCCRAQSAVKGHYTIIAPGLIRSNRPYSVAVALHDCPEPATIRIIIEGPFYYAKQEVQLMPLQSRIIVFRLPKLVRGQHKLVAEGLSGLIFRNESSLLTNPFDGPRILVQTDKAIYRPGDVVQFRVLILDEHTRPMLIEEPIMVEIVDGQNNRIKQFKDIQLHMGVYKNRFQISDYPVLGGWSITVYIGGKYNYFAVDYIQVEKYVLPKFSVYLEGDDNFVLEDPVIQLLVYGKYTFDKYVEGTISAQLTDYATGRQLQNITMEIKTTAVLEFRKEDLKDIEKLQRLFLAVVLKEKHTGETRKENMQLLVRRQRYAISVDTESIVLRAAPALSSLTAHVQHWNGSMVMEAIRAHEPLKMRHRSKEYQAFLNDKGDATFDFEYDSQGLYDFHYKESNFHFPNIYVPPQNSSNSGLKLRLVDEKLRLGTDVQVEVICSHAIDYLNLVVVGHANVIHSELIRLPAKEKSHIIRLRPSVEMIPTAFLYVSNVYDNQLYYSEIALKFPMEFENHIEVAAPAKANPGQNLSIELKAQANSYVGLMAVDLGVYLLKSTYDLNGSDILQILNEERSYVPAAAAVYPGLLAGVITLTNAHYDYKSNVDGHRGIVGPPSILNFRKKFPETWIFENYEIYNDTTVLNFTLPDSITTWRITAFSVNAVTGLAVIPQPTNIVAIKDFFIVLSLPYAVKRGELCTIPVLVHNYRDKDLETEVILHNEKEEFNFGESQNRQITKNDKSDRQRLVRVVAPAMGVVSVEFLIYPKRMGDISLKISAENELASDGVIRPLKVEAEGVMKRFSQALHVQSMTNADLTAEIPDNIVPDSEYLMLTVGGDSLVPTLNNLNALVLLPTGCGEQNMVNFAPNVLVLDYLKAAGKYYAERRLVAKAKHNIELGYQQELTYRHLNGGFSAFGPDKDTEPSSWLTAYVIRFFIKASKYFTVQSSVIEKGLEFLAAAQRPNGDFPFTGYVFYPAQQNRFGFTAFVALTFLENKKFAKPYGAHVDKAINFLSDNLHKIKDLYALAIVASALQKAKHPNVAMVLEKINRHKHQDGGLIWWSNNDRNGEKDVEITAYILLTLLEQNDASTEDLLAVYKWLLEQRNSHGGFRSTHDTVVGLQALVKFAQIYGDNQNTNLLVKYDTKDGSGGLVTVNQSNALVLQTVELPRKTRSVQLHVTGSGSALVQFSYHYHMANVKSVFNYFELEPKAQIFNVRELQVEICFSFRDYTLNATDGVSTNMIVMETHLPSGYIVSDDFSSELLEHEMVHRVDAQMANTILVIYFKKLEALVRHCIDIVAEQMHKVAELKPASVIMYDYYNTTRHRTASYRV